MTEKKRVYHSEVTVLPPLRMVLGDVPSPDPERRRKGNTDQLKPPHELIVPVKRLIAHLKEEK
jgi:hypothetical protein